MSLADDMKAGKNLDKYAAFYTMRGQRPVVTGEEGVPPAQQMDPRVRLERQIRTLHVMATLLARETRELLAMVDWTHVDSNRNHDDGERESGPETRSLEPPEEAEGTQGPYPWP